MFFCNDLLVTVTCSYWSHTSTY